MTQVGVVVTCALSLGALTFAEFRGVDRMRYWAKCTASGCFLGLAALQLHSREGIPFVAWMFSLGLVMGALGDVALLGRARHWFVAGALAFLVGNLAYVAAFSSLVAPSLWWQWSSLIPPATTVLALWWLRKGIARERVVVALYCVPLTLMAIGALTLATRGAPPELACAGLVFYVSDVLVARQRLVRASLVQQAVGRALYYGAQLTFAAALGRV